MKHRRCSGSLEFSLLMPLPLGAMNNRPGGSLTFLRGLFKRGLPAA